MKRLVLAAVALAAVSVRAQQPAGQQPPEQSFKFKSGVELINVTATVSDANGRFVPNLRKEDFLVYEDDQPQEVTHFSADRVPVSLGIALDTSGSMAGDKIREAQIAIDRFLYDLLGSQDEIFVYIFSSFPRLLQGWTTDRQAVTRALGRISPNGGTAMYDTVAEAIPMTARGQNRKKALLVISDGNDTASRMTVGQLKQRIRESESLVYAIGIDCGVEGTRSWSPRSNVFEQRGPVPIPFPIPGKRWPPPPQPQPVPPQNRWHGGCDDRVDVSALRDMTDDSGGRTEIIRDPQDLNPSTASIADELSKQYYLGYASSGRRDGRWHAIRVEVRNPAYRVRARKGYVAS